MERRIRGLALAGLLMWGPLVAAEEFGPSPGPTAAQEFKLGSLTLVALHDAVYVMPNSGKIFAVDAGPAAAAQLLKANGLPDDRITVSVNALVVRSGPRIFLLDTGLGPKVHGSLPASLQAAGIEPAQVTDILITHSHGDHIGGLENAQGGLAFPNATIRMAAAEWTFWKTQPDAAELVKLISSRVQTFPPGARISPEIVSVALKGHTPGHVGYRIESGTQRLLDIGDMAHSSVLSLAKPEWTMGFDKDPSLAKSTRRTTLAALAQDQELVFSPHFPFPGVGHVRTEGGGFSWTPGLP